MKTALFSAMLGAMLSVGTVSADDWPSFRGPAGTGLSTEKAAPSEWGTDKNVKWKAALPFKGNGSPIVSNGRVFVTCPEDRDGKKRSLYCYDRKDGKQLWVATVDHGKTERTHGTNPHSSSTPLADGKHVIAWHDSAGLFCYDFEGKQLWKRELGDFDHMWGSGISPILHDGKIILHCGPGKKVFLTSLDLASGKTLWQTDEPIKGDGDTNPGSKPMGSWCTPVVVKVGGKDQIICSMPTRVVGYDPTNGKILWWCDGLTFEKGDLAYSSPVIAGDLCIIMGGYNGPRMAIRLGGTGDVTQTHRVWRNHAGDLTPQNIGTGVALDGVVYWPYAAPPRQSIECIDPKTGTVAWSEKTKAPFWGSIVYAGGKMYVTDQQGTTVVFKPNAQKFELVATNELKEQSNSTPAISDGQIFIRTFKNLYCISE